MAFVGCCSGCFRPLTLVNFIPWGEVNTFKGTLNKRLGCQIKLGLRRYVAYVGFGELLESMPGQSHHIGGLAGFQHPATESQKSLCPPFWWISMMCHWAIRLHFSFKNGKQYTSFSPVYYMIIPCDWLIAACLSSPLFRHGQHNMIRSHLKF